MRRQRNLLGPQGMGGMVSLWGASSLIKSVQRGTFDLGAPAVTSGTATIAAVDLANSIITHTGKDYGGSSATVYEIVTRLELTNTTTVTFYINNAIAAGRILGYEVIEFRPGVLKSSQRGTISAAAASATASITEVDVNKSLVFNLGHTSNFTTYQANTTFVRMALTNGTTVTEFEGGSIQVTVGYQVAEFF